MELGEKVIIGLVVVVTLGVIIGAAIGAVFIMPAMMEEMEKPESCASNCHEMEYFLISHQNSVHNHIEDCHDCHHPHGIEMFMYMGHATHHAEAIAEAMMEGSDTNEALEALADHIEQEPPASPKVEHCMECHSKHRTPPEEIADPTISCFKCHPTIKHTTHSVGDYVGHESPSYEGHECVACHNDHDVDVTEETCNICHPPGKHK